LILNKKLIVGLNNLNCSAGLAGCTSSLKNLGSYSAKPICEAICIREISVLFVSSNPRENLKYPLIRVLSEKFSI